jgi:hypothetical protein
MPGFSKYISGSESVKIRNELGIDIEDLGNFSPEELRDANLGEYDDGSELTVIAIPKTAITDATIEMETRMDWMEVHMYQEHGMVITSTCTGM